MTSLPARATRTLRRQLTPSLGAIPWLRHLLPTQRSFPTSPTRAITTSNPTSSSPPSEAPLYPGHVRINLFQRSLLAVGSAFASITNTYRHDMIAVLSETTSGPFLARLRTEILSTPSGRSLLRERPRITEASLDIENTLAKLPAGTFGRAYADWLKGNKVTPDTRDPVRYIDDAELAYIMQRYRESHDFYHVLLGFGVSLPAELVVKWFELANFGLPVALLSSVFGPLRMEKEERRRLWDAYGSWALKSGGKAECLIGVEWEKKWGMDIGELRRELGIEMPKVNFKDWKREGRRLKKEKEEGERFKASAADGVRV
ncbi:BQ5605_C023g09721 [Microbotryum silenes-dioicae]|uniref:4-hydroxy-3-methoxy-5-polyprenylbenzoate decarboxylase n=1 Tax=Microbotryum silenes-dioicae TaxID=796604 RepID=A0A2X0MQ58_9BASI|nr:BQ5605_C023g09721 [Microbotryum silenes-dioicae]